MSLFLSMSLTDYVPHPSRKPAHSQNSLLNLLTRDPSVCKKSRGGGKLLCYAKPHTRTTFSNGITTCSTTRQTRKRNQAVTNVPCRLSNAHPYFVIIVRKTPSRHGCYHQPAALPTPLTPSGPSRSRARGQIQSAAPLSVTTRRLPPLSRKA
jgi:hypothetical protein